MTRTTCTCIDGRVPHPTALNPSATRPCPPCTGYVHELACHACEWPADDCQCGHPDPRICMEVDGA